MKNLQGKKVAKILQSLLLMTAFTILFSTCEVGLGEAVDTENPSLSVTYPPKNAVIRDKFVLAGSCKDDRGIASITVKLTNTDTSASSSFGASFNDSSWRLELNAPDASGNFPFSDGKYVAEVVAKDSAGRSSGTSSVAFDIDNTAPVMLLSKPTTTGDCNPVDADGNPTGSINPDSYGRKFQLAGDISEDHNVSYLKLKIHKYDYSGTLGDGTKLETTEIEIPVENFSQMSADNPLVVAQYYPLSETKKIENGVQVDDADKLTLRNNYLKIYGNDFEKADGTPDSTKLVDRYFYCAIELSDNAKLYQTPGDSGSGTGNVTDKYYLSTTEFYDSLQSESKSKYGLSAYKLKNMLNGTGTDWNADQINEINTLLNTKGFTASSQTVAADSSSVFLINPNNSPTWNISGYEIGNANNDQLTEGAGDYRTYYSGSALALNFAAGKDQSYVKPKSIVMTKYHLIKNDAGNYVIDASSAEKIKLGENGGETWNDSPALNGSKTINLSSSSENALIEEELYAFTVTGQDLNGNDIEPVNASGYGFVVASNTNPPTIVFTEEDKYFSGKDAAASGIKLVGTISTEAKALHSSTPLVLVEKDDAKNLSYVTNEATGTVIATLKPSYATSTTVTRQGDTSTYDFNMILKNDALVPSTPGKYKYKATLEAKDERSRAAQKYVYFHIDNKDPEISINSVTPVVEKTVNSQTVKYVNGEITVKTNISDNYEIKESTYAVKSTSSGTPADGDTVIKTESLGTASSPDIPVDTRTIAQNTKIYVQVDAEDKAGTLTNKASQKTDVYVVDQETDRPVLTPSNFSIKGSTDAIKANDNLFGTTNNNRLLGTVEDDDGLKSVVFEYRKDGAGSWTTLKTYSDINSTTLSFDVTLPTDEAKYEIRIFANDTVYGKDAVSYSASNYGTFQNSTFVAVSKGAPTITIDQTEPVYIKPNTTKEISGKVKSVTDVTVKGTNAYNSGTAEEILDTTFASAVASTASGAVWKAEKDQTVEGVVTKVQTFKVPDDAAEGTTGVLTFTASNTWSETSSAELNYTVDKTEPAFINTKISDSADYRFKVNNTVWTSSSWYKNNSLSVTGFVEEATSGIDKIYYIINPTASSTVSEENSFSATKVSGTNYWKFSSNIAGFAEGENTLRLIAYDKAGNVSGNEDYIINVDLTAPGVEGTSTINFSNGQADIVFSGTATDPQATAGLKVSGVDGSKIAATISLSTVTGSNYAISTTSNDYGVISYANGIWTLTIDCYDETKKEIKSWLKDKSGKLTVKVSASDNAGNSSGSITVTNITIDAKAPEPSITIPVEGTTVNKSLTIRGSVSEENELSTTVIDWRKSSDADADASYSQTGLASGSFSGTAGFNWSTTLNTTMLSVSDGTGIVIRVRATDSAGNIGTVTRSVTVDQNTDRPVIRFTNLSLNDGTVVLGSSPTADEIKSYNEHLMSSTNYIWVKNSSELYGNIDDDDSGSETVVMKYIIKDDSDTAVPAKADWSSSKAKSVTLDSSNSWNITLPGQGKQRLYFYIKDSEGTEFYPASDADSGTMTVRLSDGKTRFGKISSDTATISQSGYVPSDTTLYARVDTSAPELLIGDLSVDGKTFTDATTYNAKTWYNKTLESDKFNLGGTTEFFEIKVNATDANGIASVTGYTKDLFDKTTVRIIGSGTLPNQSQLAADYTIVNDTDGSITAYKSDYTVASDIKDASFWIVKIPCGGTAYRTNKVSGTMTVNIMAVDGAGISSSQSFTVNVDNTAPVITPKSPVATKQVSGDVTVYGEVDTPNKIWYAVSPDGEHAPDGSTKVTKWSDSSDVETAIASASQKTVSYTEVKDPSILWFLYFDGDTDASLTTTHDKLLKEFLIDYGIASRTELYGDDATGTERSFFKIVKLYVWIKANDAAGNVSEIAHEILLDPQGDLPSVTIDYPDATGTTLGGEVTLRGSGTDPNGSVENVFVQMISEKDVKARITTGTDAEKKTALEAVLKYTVTDSKITSDSQIKTFAPTKEDVALWISRGYSVYNISSRSKSVKADGSDKSNLLGTQVTDASSLSSTDAANCMILAEFKGSSWKLSVNSPVNNVSPLDPDSGSEINPVAFRVWAEDNDANLSSYAQSLNPFDADTPQFSDLTIVQSASEGISAADTGSMTYVPNDNWLKGDWYIKGKVTDKDTIKTLKIDGKEFISNGSIASEGTGKVTRSADGKTVEFKYTLSTGSGVGVRDFNIVAEDDASTPHPATQNISVNYDNVDPTLISSSDDGYDISSEIKQKNNFYTFGSKVKEEAVNSKNQSGFNYILFYFTRNHEDSDNKTVTYIYDPMLVKTATYNKVLSTATGLTSSDGLYWYKRTSVTHSSDSPSTLSWTTQAGDDNIHKGGICRIGKAMYFISSVTTGTTTTVELDGSPDAKWKDAEFAFANVVNNTIAESEHGTLGDNGYYPSPYNDDGDTMIESVSKSGAVWTWEANINSKNISDGPVTLNYVAFDKAGNSASGSVSGFVKNNAPRLAGVKVGSDYNGNNAIDSGEWVTQYARGADEVPTKESETVTGLIASQDQTATGAAIITVKGYSEFVPEIVGGNGDLYYSYSIGANPTLSTDSEGEIVHKSVDDWEKVNSIYGNFEKSFATGKSDYYKTVSSTKVLDITDDKPIKFQTGDYYRLDLPDSDNTTWFNFRIWDSTEEKKVFKDTQYAELSVAVDMKARTTSKPNAKIKPFYWTDKNTNSLYENSASNGHIELESDWTKKVNDAYVTSYSESATDGITDGDPKVSGKIVLRGTAHDDKLLSELYVYIPGMETVFADKVKDASGNVLKTTASIGGNSKDFYRMASYDESSSTWTYPSADIANGFAFSVTKSIFSSAGHDVEWELSWDTSTINNTAAKDVDVQILAVNKTVSGKKTAVKDATTKEYTYTYDYSNTKSGTSIVQTANGEANLTSRYRMDVVPYITGITTELSALTKQAAKKSQYSRTTLGHYPVRVVGNGTSITDGETITVAGFNIPSSQTSYAAKDLTTAADSSTGTRSCKFTITVNGVDSINNVNNNNATGSYEYKATAADVTAGRATTVGEVIVLPESASYDTKATYAYNRAPNNINNNLLTDDVYFDVWQFNSSAVVPISGKIEQPVMKIRPTDGKIGFAFVNGPLYFSMGGSPTVEDYSYQYWTASYDFFTSVGFTYDSFGNSYGVAAGGDINSGSADAFILMSSKFSYGAYGQRGSYDGFNTDRLERIGQVTNSVMDFDKQRIKSPSLATGGTGNDTNLYLAYYDAMNDELRFKSGTAKGNVPSNTVDTTKSWVRRIEMMDNPKSSYAGAWVYKTSSGTTISKDDIKDGDHVYFCKSDGTLLSNDYYILGGKYYPNGDYLAFTITDKHNRSQTPFINPVKGSSYNYTQSGDYRILTDDVYIKIVSVETKDTNAFGQFQDSATTTNPTYSTANVSLIAKTSSTTYGAGSYVSLAVIPGTTDTVIAVWYDQSDATNAVLRYAYNTNPVSSPGSWTYVESVFDQDSDMAKAGEYCKVEVDSDGGVHIAAYDPVNLDLCYAYLDSSKAGKPSSQTDFKTCIVDGNGVVGSNLTLDVAKDGNRVVPFIGYYSTSCIRPKMAHLVGSAKDTDIVGTVDDEFTGKWECTVVPTSSSVEMQSNQHNDINIGVWKSSGAITTSSSGTATHYNNASSYNSTSYGQVYGNGQKTPVLGYAIKVGAKSDNIETAQMK